MPNIIIHHNYLFLIGGKRISFRACSLILILNLNNHMLCSNESKLSMAVLRMVNLTKMKRQLRNYILNGVQNNYRYVICCSTYAEFSNKFN